MERIVEFAKLFASEAHEGQTDKIGMPYFAHALRVSEMVPLFPSYHDLSEQQKENAVVSALLHDVVEDTHVTLSDMCRAGFNSEVLETVELLTYTQKITRLKYYSYLIVSPVARIVKTSDIAHNSSHSRLIMLPLDVQERLKVKYAEAKKQVVLPSDYEKFTFLIQK